MSEHDHDKLEEFFRKASVRPDVPFNEDDWKKLEARLDAEDLSGVSVSKKAGAKMAAAIVAGVILLFTGAYWVNSRYGIIDLKRTSSAPAPLNEENQVAITDSNEDQSFESDERKHDEKLQMPDAPPEAQSSPADKINAPQKNPEIPKPVAGFLTDNDESPADEAGETFQDRMNRPDASSEEMTALMINQGAAIATLDREKVFRELIVMSPANAEKIKQRANVDLPGAEEGDTGEAPAIVTEEDASVKRVVTPRLSLLLSFAPDFSSTTISEYTAPGKAFGAMMHYHVMNRWSISGGVIKNYKRYSSAGDDYTPPKGYWKNYTNGIIPNTIDGSCSILEFPVMIQYTIASSGKNRWLAGAGASSYLMLNESYKYYFEEPNPGAKEGWNSKRTSRFLFNMLNLTIGYERQVVPGLMLGLEPYVKIPLKELGWANIKLFSTGASITLRYKILGRQTVSMPNRNRGPD